MENHEFWIALDKLVFESKIIIDRAVGSPCLSTKILPWTTPLFHGIGH